MSTFKKTQVVMLPTNEKATLLSDGNYNHSFIHRNNLIDPNPSRFRGYELYFLSDEPIKEGDWYIDESVFKGAIYQMKHSKWGDEGQGNCKKIIATTDKSIILPERFPSFTYLPQPSQSFIEKFVDEYNRGNVITEVMVEYEGICSNCSEYHEDSILCSDRDGFDTKVEPFRLKVSKNNIITIRKTKESWNRDEVIQLMEKAINRGMQLKKDYQIIHKKSHIDKWISENL